MSTNDNNNQRRAPSLWVWLAAITALMSAMSMGATLGWSAPGLPSLSKSGSEPQLTDENLDTKTWIGSSMTLGALVGGLLGGPLLQWLGVKKVIIGLGAPFIVGWVLICAAKGFALIIIGRVLTGFAAGISCGVAPTYCVHISTPKIRGLLGTGFQAFVNIGILYMSLLGLAVSWRWLAIIGLIPSVLMSIGMIFMPDSPNWLMVKHGRHGSQVADALRRLRSADSDIDTELKELEDMADKAGQSGSFSIGQLKRPDIYMPFIICNFLMFFQQFSGINAVLFYLNDIFKDAGSAMDPMVSTCIVNASMVAAVIGGALIIDRLGRRVLLLASGAGHTVTLAIMGYYYYSDNKSLSWLPIVCLIFFVVSFNIGYGPIPWMIVAEITPSYAMGPVSACGTAFNWLCAFIVTKQFDAIQEAMQRYGAFWLFAGISAASIVFVVMFVPETKGKSVDEMQRIFLKTKSPADHQSDSPNKYSVNNNKDVINI
ncbi:facilitated trehalose transporter Tret1-2 homolog [Oppia nitens]|uniref:facilitated trehalose transporter Tret1-2 homolog n=1 Tax=Oppia nitens TaxID=1686743 RepID=UPI0023DCC500|nr:facilitated trehalose transporter Tret1-2 homolog [Oppia nitens]